MIIQPKQGVLIHVRGPIATLASGAITLEEGDGVLLLGTNGYYEKSGSDDNMLEVHNESWSFRYDEFHENTLAGVSHSPATPFKAGVALNP